MKYRRLHTEELENLEKDFIQFLAANSITGDDWEKLKTDNPKQVNSLMDIFSTTVWDKVLVNIKCLEVRTIKDLKVFRFGKEEAELINLRIGQDNDFDLTNPKHILTIAEASDDISNYNPEFYQGNKSYKENREQEIFDMMENGAQPCKEAFYLSLLNMVR